MKKLFSKLDFSLLVLTVFYAIFGSIMIYSASSILTFMKQDVASDYYFVRQLAILFVCFVGALVCLKIPTKFYQKLFWFPMGAVIFLLLALIVSGSIVNGSKAWFDFGYFSLQPSEFAKGASIIFMAASYDLLIRMKRKEWYLYLIPLVIVALAAGIVLMQPDLGGAIILVGIAGFMFIAAPIEKQVKNKCWKAILVVIAFMGVLLFAFKDKVFSEYQMSRLTFSAPCTRYTESTGYQVCNGFIAIKNGGLFGLGFGKSTQKYLYLPEAHTDFIFPIIVEELGLLAGIAIILGYLYMLYRLLCIARKAPNVRNSLIAYGTCVYLGLHILINLLGVLALIPLTGVPLPFLSYGGSFALNAFLLLGICQRISIETKNYQIKEKIAKM